VTKCWPPSESERVLSMLADDSGRERAPERDCERCAGGCATSAQARWTRAAGDRHIIQITKLSPFATRSVWLSAPFPVPHGGRNVSRHADLSQRHYPYSPRAPENIRKRRRTDSHAVKAAGTLRTFPRL